jgi:uncharacterized protein with HEPN domain
MELYATDRERLAFLLEADVALYLNRLWSEAEVADVTLPEDELPEDQRPKYVTNYIGSKQKLVEWIWKHTPEGIASVLDAFSGSAVVAYMYKSKGLRVVANDRLRYAYHAARAIIENTATRITDDDMVTLLANNPKAGTIVRDKFKGIYFADGVHALIDQYRANIDALSGYKKDIALFALGKACLAGKGGFGHFSSSADFGKRQDSPEEFRQRYAKNIARINALVFDNGTECKASRKDIVRELFQLYRRHQGMLPVVEEAQRRGWRTKTWVTRAGRVREGGPLDRPNLHHLLRNVTYLGKVAYDGEIFEGEHEAVVDEALFHEVQEILKSNGRSRGHHVSGRSPDALLKGLLTCGQCGKAMIHTCTSKPDGTRYRYYVCTTSQKRGVKACSSSTIPAAEIERYLVEQLRALATNPDMVADVVAEASRQRTQRVPALRQDMARLQQQLLERQQAEQHLRRTLESQEHASSHAVVREQLQVVGEQIKLISQHLRDARREVKQLDEMTVSDQTLHATLQLFDPVWEVLYPIERVRILRLLLGQVDYNGKTGKLGITFHPLGIVSLHEEIMAAAARLAGQASGEETI